MSKYGNVTFRDLTALAKQYGFVKIRQQGTSHGIFSNGTKIVVIPMHKGKVIGKGLAVKIIKALKTP